MPVLHSTAGRPLVALMAVALLLTVAVSEAVAAPAVATDDNGPTPGSTCPCMQEVDPSSTTCYHWTDLLPAVGGTAGCKRVACAPRYLCVAQPLATHMCHVTAVTAVPVCSDRAQPTACNCLRTSVVGPTHLTPIQATAWSGVTAVDPPLNCQGAPVVRIGIEDKPFKCVKEVNTKALSVHDAYFGGGTTTRQSGWHTRGDWVHVHFLASGDATSPHGVCFTNGGGAAAIADAPGTRGVDIFVTTPTGTNTFLAKDPADAPSPANATFGYTTMHTTDGLLQSVRQSWPNGGPGRGFCVRMPSSAPLGVELKGMKWLRGMMFFSGGTDYPLAGGIHMWCAYHSAIERGSRIPPHWGRRCFRCRRGRRPITILPSSR
eukprot:TRINITY_DN2299_c0_g1_i1.p1 TRINITY_DN2299_c0_g1~~TRINITY_DN2299_c0_g1_i1.p1  ORF type:complete len:375 (+),score=39.41 TRINITY_DN2299_c0_g1_i1:594-1718(+)